MQKWTEMTKKILMIKISAIFDPLDNLLLPGRIFHKFLTNVSLETFSFHKELESKNLMHFYLNFKALN